MCNDSVSEVPRTELDSHAASIVVGKNVLITHESGRTITVGPFTKSLGSMNDVPVVDCVVAYDCPYSDRTVLLAMHNALYIPEMEENLLPPFVVRRQGHKLSEIPKIQVDDPKETDHCLELDDNGMRIPLQLNGIVSYFHTRKPTEDEYEEAIVRDNVISLNVDEEKWDPHDERYARDEECMLDFNGRVIEKEHRQRHLFDDNDVVMDEVKVGGINEIDDITLQISAMSVNDGEAQKPPDNKAFVDGKIHHLCSISNTLDVNSFAEDLVEHCAMSKFAHANESKSMKIGAVHADKGRGVSPDDLAKVFRIDRQTAKSTLKVTTQRLKRSKHPTLNRRFNSNDRMLRYRHLREYFYMDTMFASKKFGKTLQGNTCMQLFVTDKGFVHVIPMKSKKEVPLALKEFFKKVGVPDAVICDEAKEQIMGDSRKIMREAGTTIRAIEPGTPWSNRAERYIGMFKQRIRDVLRETDCPMVLWDFCAQHQARINNVTAKSLFQLHGRTPYETVYKVEPDISNLCQFKFYDWCYYRDNMSKFPYPSEFLGRILGPSEDYGNEMCFWILRSDGRVIPRQTVRVLTSEEINSPLEINKRNAFDKGISNKLGNSIAAPPTEVNLDDFVPYEDDEGTAFEMSNTDDEDYDRLVNAEVILPHRDKQSHATVIGKHVDSDGQEKGRSHDNPILDTTVYDVMFHDGTVKQYSANITAQNMWAQVDHEGHQYLTLDSIIDHRKDDTAVDKEDQYLVTKRGRKKLRQTTTRWHFVVQWKTGEQQWVPLKDLKESNPVEVADYVKANGLIDEPAFKWWVPYTLRKRDYIIAKVTARVKKKTHKYGIKIPRTVKEAYELDKINGNTYWRDAIAKEMENVSIAFDILEDDEGLPPGYQLASCHLIFDVKMDFTRKARFVLDGHKTPDPDGSTYAGVVSRESTRIAFTYAALNGIEIWMADILNAYLQAPSSEKHYIICGLEFGLENHGKRAKIVRALYGGKTSGRDFRNHLRSCMEHLEFKSCKADPDVWYRGATKSDGSKYYEYALLYVDDVLVMSENAEDVLRKEIGRYFTLKKESIGEPDVYLGGKVSRVELDNGVLAYSFSSSQYVKAAIDNVEAYLKENDLKFPCRVMTPLSSNYRPELDVSDELTPGKAAYYQSLIGILRWMVELGRVDITCEVSMMSSHLALPREGHLQQLFHIFAYLKKNHNTEMVFDPSEPDIDLDEFKRENWDSSEYAQLEEEIPGNAPDARGMGFTITAYVDSDHAGDTITRRSRTGYIIYLNSAPVYWHSKKQNSVETSTFGAEFTAMKQCTEYLRGLRYKLRMMGIPVEGPCYVYGDNQSVLKNASLPDSVLKKKSNSIAYNFVREGSAMDEWRTSYINTQENVDDMLTKPLASGEKRTKFIRKVLYHI